VALPGGIERHIEVTGMQNVTKAQSWSDGRRHRAKHLFHSAGGREGRKLEQIPWVESASVMRFVPNRLQVEIHERTPVAFARVGPRMALIDAVGRSWS